MRLKKRENLIESIENDELIILNMNNGKYYGLQDTSLEIWNLINSKSEKEIVGHFIKNYEVEVESIKKEVEDFIRKLKKEGLVKYEKK